MLQAVVFGTTVVGAVMGGAWPRVATAQSANPFEGDADAIGAGEALYASRCPECHGADARGLSGPDLTVLWSRGSDDERVFEIIRDGVADSIMPPSNAPDEEIWAIVAFLRSVSTVPPYRHAAGDAARGHEAFKSRCMGCHRVGGTGATLGPDLSRIAESRSLAALTQSIKEPSAAIAAGFRVVTVVTRGRERVRGLVKAEDAFSIQLLDVNERLRAFLKADLREIIRDERSLMSELDAGALPPGELDDLLAFLATLRADGQTIDN